MTHPNLSRAIWRKPSRSGGDNGNCVEVASNLPDLAAVRDSKNPTGPALTFTPAAFGAFIGATKRGQFDI